MRRWHSMLPAQANVKKPFRGVSSQRHACYNPTLGFGMMQPYILDQYEPA
jgi:hypothetical protein